MISVPARTYWVFSLLACRFNYGKSTPSGFRDEHLKALGPESNSTTSPEWGGCRRDVRGNTFSVLLGLLRRRSPGRDERVSKDLHFLRQISLETYTLRWPNSYCLQQASASLNMFGNAKKSEALCMTI